MTVSIVEGDLLDQPVDVIVNAWNRNTIPWWLLLPQGVSGAIKRRAGTEPFRELAKYGRMRLGDAVATGAGRLPFRGIIHVAGINDVWRASEGSIRRSVQNSVQLAVARGWTSIGFPVLGAGSGGFDAVQAERIMIDELREVSLPVKVTIVRYVKR